jgi:hypothetical protein
VFVAVGVDSVATFTCSLLRTSSQTFSTPPPFCVGALACVVLFLKYKSRYHEITISKAFNIYCSPDTAETVCPAVSIFNDTIFMFTRLIGTLCVVMMLSTACCQVLSHRTLSEIATGLWLQMPVVHFHLHNPHKLNLPGEFLYLLLRQKRKKKF